MSDRHTILAIDDEEPVRNLYERVLGRAGYDVVVAEDGLQALGMAQEREFDVVLMDLKMPQLDGLEAITVLQSVVSHTPIIVVTGYAGQQMLARARQAGANQIVLKPFKAAQLLQAIEQAIREPIATTTG